MELFIILMVIVMVFNALNAAMQKARQSGRSQSPRAVRKTYPQAMGDPRGRPPRRGVERMPTPAEPEWAGEGKSLMWHGENTVTAPPLQQAAGESNARAAVSASLEKILQDQDSLVAAFIFHEIIDRPLSLRRR